MRIILIAAVARNRVIGRKGRLPWHIPEDLERFKRMTVGRTVLMGRSTFESLNTPLPDRRNIVLSSVPLDGVECYPSFEAARAALSAEPELFVIGGARVFAEALPAADELRLTLVDQEVEGDTFFPAYEDLVRNEFCLVLEEHHRGFAFLNYVRNTRNVPR